MNKEIEKKIIKYFDGRLTDNEAIQLIRWINDGNIHVFNEYIMLNFTIDTIEALKQESNIELWEKIAANLDKPENKIRPGYWRYAIAAAVAVLITSSIFILNVSNKIKDNEIVNSTISIPPGTDKAVLTLENGNNVVLEKDNSFHTNGLKSEGESVVYRKDSDENNPFAYHYLTIPRGGQFFVELSDGTKIWLNSDSKLKYPMSFAKNQSREVELVYGEAYFDVSNGTNHNNAKFIVHHRQQEVEVLGTEFNIKAYKEEHDVFTTLVEGKVAIEVMGEKEILAPNQQLRLNVLNNGVAIAQVDTYSETSWKIGTFSFKNKTLEDIMKVLSRWYEIDVVFADASLRKEVFSGTLKKSLNMVDIMKTITQSNNIDYEINETSVILNRNN